MVHIAQENCFSAQIPDRFGKHSLCSFLKDGTNVIGRCASSGGVPTPAGTLVDYPLCEHFHTYTKCEVKT